MTALFILVPLAIVFVAVMLGAFVWATRRGQFDDLQTPAVRILADDD
ncbi:MAG: cbb3-type cytochrome oxidase assembly protein CcoS [Myxococcota bacterium]